MRCSFDAVSHFVNIIAMEPIKIEDLGILEHGRDVGTLCFDGNAAGFGLFYEGAFDATYLMDDT